MAAPAETRLVSQIYVKINGLPLMGRVMEDLIQAQVESTVHLPDLATIQFNNPELEWSDGEKFKIGQEVEIELGDERLKRKVFDGEITALDLDVGIEGDVSLVVRAYDRAHRLHRGCFTRPFLNMTDSDIAKKIAGELKLDTNQIESTRQVHKYLLQHNQTNWEFLQERAKLLGFELQVQEKKLVFKPPPSTPAELLTLAWKTQLLAFHASLTSGEQVNEVEVRGWNPQQKKPVSGIAKRPELLPNIGVRQTGGELAESAFHKEARVVVARQPVYSQEEAKVLAQIVLEDLSSVYVTADGVAMGDPRLRLGSTVKVESVGKQFSGEYVVTQARHVYRPAGYHIEFEVTGRRSTDLVSLLASPRTEAGVHVLQGIVTNTQDPDDLGRVKVKFPTLSADAESNWCRVVSPGAGPQRGLQLIPEVDDEVLAFGTDINNLYVLGGLWNGVDLPPLKNSDAAPGGVVIKRVLRSRTGHQILIEDPAGDPPPHGGGITIIDSTGKNKIVIDTKTNSLDVDFQGDIKIKAGGNLVITAKKDIKIEASGDLNLDAARDASLDARATLELKGGALAKLAAPQVSLGQ